jgi:DNA-binding NtrC family response regulator
VSPRILLVEDDSILRFLIADALSDLQVEVIECGSADTALAELENFTDGNSVALMMTDIRMPGHLDGFELAQIVWKRWPEIPVILTSGHWQVADHQLPEHSLFMAKPWTLDQLYQAVTGRLNRVQWL